MAPGGRGESTYLVFVFELVLLTITMHAVYCIINIAIGALSLIESGTKIYKLNAPLPRFP